MADKTKKDADANAELASMPWFKQLSAMYNHFTLQIDIRRLNLHTSRKQDMSFAFDKKIIDLSDIVSYSNVSKLFARWRCEFGDKGYDVVMDHRANVMYLVEKGQKRAPKIMDAFAGHGLRYRLKRKRADRDKCAKRIRYFTNASIQDGSDSNSDGEGNGESDNAHVD